MAIYSIMVSGWLSFGYFALLHVLQFKAVSIFPDSDIEIRGLRHDFDDYK